MNDEQRSDARRTALSDQVWQDVIEHMDEIEAAVDATDGMSRDIDLLRATALTAMAHACELLSKRR